MYILIINLQTLHFQGYNWKWFLIQGSNVPKKRVYLGIQFISKNVCFRKHFREGSPPPPLYQLQIFSFRYLLKIIFAQFNFYISYWLCYSENNIFVFKYLNLISVWSGNECSEMNYIMVFWVYNVCIYYDKWTWFSVFSNNFQPITN